ncbi:MULTISPECIES: hypothetical protein [Salimicrobium]|uniref:hypothetical protein n=1 Tax=Salimicrobium TaxID=351195 RepID=UPI00117A642F|nr:MULTISPECIES: hypothetical protein [Salimicrobium]
MTKNKIKKGKAEIHTEKLEYDEAKLFEVNDSEIKTLVVPVISENHHEISNVAFYFNNTNEIESYTELIVKKSVKNTFHIVLYLNGETHTDEVTNETFTTAKDYQQQQANSPISTLGMNWGGLLDCLGITGVGASVIAGACAVACAFTAGTACIVCAATFLGVRTGTVAACVGGNVDF